ncbi:DUF7507 domain-containing protein [Algoriphagus sediminis]|uniref:Gliding motility-associated C-terminal domain-containing protein n=1 Tax=Algoriphagus sediminis TaxID=3057113 RepID=A0ABT7YHI4_9BACT|nr:gliding motility-associated C-terminal domain-containing protein [Algoriphagus sediminis]MDN3205971.1 gliding motility-associated C-terminal domain-containing protein [Algoriphagus sediminis]
MTETWVYTATYSVKQSDIEAGEIVNQAEAEGFFGQQSDSDLSGSTVETDEDTIVDICQDSGIKVVKTSDQDPGSEDCIALIPGTEITYTFTVTNEGNVGLGFVEVTDELEGLSDLSEPVKTGGNDDDILDVDETWTYTATYTVQEGDIQLGEIENTVEVTAITGDEEIVRDEDTLTIPLCQEAGIRIVKTSDQEPTGEDDCLDLEESDIVTYTFTVTNAGDVPLSNVTVTDPLTDLSAIELQSGDINNDDILDLTEIWVYTATYSVKQSDIDAGEIVNQATAEGFFGQEKVMDLSGTTVDTDDETIIPICQEEGLDITKTVLSNDDEVDGIVSFEIEVTNTGNVSLFDVVVTDETAFANAPDAEKDQYIWTISELTPGASETFQVDIEITQELFEAECYENTATAKVFEILDEFIPQDVPGQGSDSDDLPVRVRLSDEASAEACFTLETGLSIQKDVVSSMGVEGRDYYESVGDEIVYKYIITNTGNVNLTGPIQVTDDKIPNIPAVNQDLAIGESVEVTASYFVVQDDFEAPERFVTNTAFATAQFGQEEVKSNEDSETVRAVIIILDRVNTFCELDAPYIEWELEGFNLDLLDQNLGPNPLTMIWRDKDGIEITRVENVGFSGVMLFPGAEVNEDGYGTQWPGWDLQNGQWVQGDFRFAAVREPGTTVEWVLNPEVSSPVAYPGATDECNPNPNPPLAVDDDMTSTPVVSELGFEDIVNVLDNDELNGQVGLNTTQVDITIVTESNPGVIILDPATGLVDVAPGTPSGIYTLEYRICTNPNPTNCDTAIVTVLVVTPSIEILKDGVFTDENNDGFAQVGESVTYTFTVINTGDIELNNITIEDDKVEVQGGPLNGLGAGQSDSNTFSASYILTQNDIDEGLVLNIATVKGEGPGGYPVEDESEDPTPVESPSDPDCPDCTETEIPQNPAIEILKDGLFNDENNDGFGQVGETITYKFTVSNVGNVTLSNVTVTDAKVDVQGGPLASLAVGATDSNTFFATYVLTQSDIDNGVVLNIATAKGTSPKGVEVEDQSEDPTPVESPSDPDCPDCTETEIPQNPAIEILKDGEFQDENGDGFGQVGETITYTFTVSNTGNVTLSNVTITDAKVDVQGGPIALAPGQTDNTTFTASYVLTQSDVDNGLVLNIATAKGTSPKGVEVEDQSEDPTPVESPSDPDCPDCTETEIPQDPSIEILKDGVFSDANEDGVAQVGETVVYTFTVTNTGNVTLSGITVEDDLVTVTGGPIDLAPGETDTDTFSAVYVLTQEDIDRGWVANIALARGDAPGGDPEDPSDDITDDSEDPTPIPERPDDSDCEGDCTFTDIPQNPALTIVKTADKTVVENAGEVITYTIEVSNSGNLTLTNIMVEDPLTGLEEEIDELVPGESVSLNTTYTVTTADLVAQEPILNVAKASADDPTGEDEEGIEAEDEEVVEIGDCIELITGIVFNAITDSPIANVPMTLVPQGNTPGETLIVLTDAEGRYVFKGIPAGNYLLQVQDANLNAQGLFNFQKSSLSFISVEECSTIVDDFPYAPFEGIVLGDFVWYDLNEDGIQNEWFDANDDGQVTLNDPTAGPITISEWEWFDLNGDGRYDGPENEGELNKAGLAGNATPGQPGNITVTGPNGFESNQIVGILGYWRERIGATEDDGFDDQGGALYGEYTAVIVPDPVLSASASAMEATGLVKILPDAGARMTDINGVRLEEQCGLTTDDTVDATVTAEDRVHLDMDFGLICRLVEIEIIANDDDFGEYFVSYGGPLGNILENDILDGVVNPDPDLVDFEFTDLDGVVGLLIDENGDLSLIPGVNEAREYRLRYVLRETAFPDNNDDAFVVFRLLNDQVDLSVEKTSFEAEIYEGDEFEYEIRLSNVGGTPATNVELVDDLPGAVTYLSSEVVSVSDPQIEVGTPSVSGSRITWSIPFLPAEGEVVIRVLVKAGDAGTITNIAEVNAEEEDIEPNNNRDDDVNEILPFRIPNVITPDLQDGDNDTFEILGLGKFVSNEIVIINRYGDHVLEQEDYRNDWNAPGQVSGTYFYILKVVDRQGEEHEFRGWIQVIKGDK